MGDVRRENLVLASLPDEERERLDPFLAEVELAFLEDLIEPNEPIRYVVFPYDAISSTIQEMMDGGSAETGLMGIEGIIGIQVWLRVRTTPTISSSSSLKRWRSSDVRNAGCRMQFEMQDAGCKMQTVSRTSGSSTVCILNYES